MSNPVGHPPDPPNLEREAWMERFGFAVHQRPNRDFPASLMRQLSCCRSDEARRIILDRTEKYVEGEVDPTITLRSLKVC
jgi:hypothetical protein